MNTDTLRTYIHTNIHIYIYTYIYAKRKISLHIIVEKNCHCDRYQNYL